MTVRISGPPDRETDARLDIPLLETRAHRILSGLGHSRSELSVALVGDREIAELNHQYRDKRAATDVLSFSLVEGDHADHRGGLLGDVVISLETARRQARERHRGLDEELARLLIHGVLHLLGHDHEEEEEWRVMRAEERRLWASIRP
jgi:probable rRNA maturation factor